MDENYPGTVSHILVIDCVDNLYNEKVTITGIRTIIRWKKGMWNTFKPDGWCKWQNYHTHTNS
jgi:hypothetical protein